MSDGYELSDEEAAPPLVVVFPPDLEQALRLSGLLLRTPRLVALALAKPTKDERHKKRTGVRSVRSLPYP